MSLSLSKIIGRPARVMLFYKNAPIMWDGTGLKENSNRVTPKAYTPKSPLGPLPPNSSPTPKIIFFACSS